MHGRPAPRDPGEDRAGRSRRRRRNRAGRRRRRDQRHAAGQRLDRRQAERFEVRRLDDEVGGADHRRDVGRAARRSGRARQDRALRRTRARARRRPRRGRSCRVRRRRAARPMAGAAATPRADPSRLSRGSAGRRTGRRRDRRAARAPAGVDRARRLGRAEVRHVDGVRADTARAREARRRRASRARCRAKCRRTRRRRDRARGPATSPRGPSARVAPMPARRSSGSTLSPESTPVVCAWKTTGRPVDPARQQRGDARRAVVHAADDVVAGGVADEPANDGRRHQPLAERRSLAARADAVDGDAVAVRLVGQAAVRCASSAPARVRRCATR